MGGEWTHVSVAEIGAPWPHALATGPFGSAISSRHFLSAGVPVIRGSNLSQNVGTRLIDDGLAFLTTEKAAEFSRSIARRGDLVFTCWGTIGQVGLVDSRARYGEYVVSNKQMKLTPDPEKADSLYLYYAFSSPPVADDIRNRAIGSSVPGFNLGQLRELRLRLPSLPVQRAIAHVLGTLDDKIELNRLMNETLESIARALFKSWFVDAPDESWTTAPLAEWVDVLSGGTPSKANPAFWNGTLKWISPKSMTSIHADECDDHVSEQAIGNGTRLAPKGATLIMVRGMGLHDGVRVSQAREDLTFNQDVKALVPKKIEPDLLLFAMLDAQEELHQRVETSGHGTGKMPSEILLAHPITMPLREVQRERVVHISALNDRIASNRSESSSLARLRDELLPRLLSGELSVAHAERAVEEVA